MSVVSMDEATLNQMHQEAEPKDVVNFKHCKAFTHAEYKRHHTLV
jgi:hypothetical protein